MSLFSLCLRLSSLCDGNRRSEVMTKCFLLLVICFIILIHFCVGRNPCDTFFHEHDFVKEKHKPFGIVEDQRWGMRLNSIC